MRDLIAVYSVYMVSYAFSSLNCKITKIRGIYNIHCLFD